MRPVSRPTYTGKAAIHYKDYLQALITAYGSYCSCCERPDKVDVEHVEPASKNLHLKLAWSNLLLVCPRCNRDFKRSTNQDRQGYVWPDQDNTYKLIDYLDDGRVRPAAELPAAMHSAVQATIDLVCLDDSLQDQKPLNLGRKRCFDMANIVKDYFQKDYMTVDEVMKFAEGGHWSIWYRIFQAFPDVIAALETLHPNTDIHRL